MDISVILPIVIFCISLISSSAFATERIMRLRRRIQGKKTLKESDMQEIVDEFNTAITELKSTYDFQALEWTH